METGGQKAFEEEELKNIITIRSVTIIFPIKPYLCKRVDKRRLNKKQSELFIPIMSAL